MSGMPSVGPCLFKFDTWSEYSIIMWRAGRPSPVQRANGKKVRSTAESMFRVFNTHQSNKTGVWEQRGTEWRLALRSSWSEHDSVIYVTLSQ